MVLFAHFLAESLDTFWRDMSCCSLATHISRCSFHQLQEYMGISFEYNLCLK
jgi:hypothetical protein